MSSSSYQTHNHSIITPGQGIDPLMALDKREPRLKDRWIPDSSDPRIKPITWSCSLTWEGQEFTSSARYHTYKEAKRDVARQILTAFPAFQPQPPPPAPLLKYHREVEIIDDRKPNFKGKFYLFTLKELKERTYLSEDKILAVQARESASFRGDLKLGKYAVSPWLVDLGGPLEFQE